MSEEQDKEKISAALHGGSIKAENITIIQNHGSSFGQNSNIGSSKNETSQSVKIKNKLSQGIVITIVLGVISAAIWKGFENQLFNQPSSSTTLVNVTEIKNVVTTSRNQDPPFSTSQSKPSRSKTNEQNQKTQIPSGFKAGTYTDESKNINYKMSGPSNLANRETWTISNSDRSFSAQWYTGPKERHPSLTSYRYEYKLADGLSYGRVGTIDPKAHDQQFKNWGKEHVVSALQTGKDLTITQYTNGRPGETLTLTLQE